MRTTVLVLLASLLLMACVQHTSQTLPHKTNLTLHADSYSLKIMNCKVNYTFTIDVIDGKEILRFKGVSSDCKNPLYERLDKALKNSVLIDTGDHYYLYMPSVSPYVVKYKPLNSIVRYRGLPIVTFYNLMKTFNNAENVSYLGEKDGLKVFKYSFRDGELGRVYVKVHIKDGIPVKAVLRVPQYNATLVTEIWNVSKGVKDFNLSGYEIVER